MATTPPKTSKEVVRPQREQVAHVEPIPSEFLEVRVRRLDIVPSLIGLCVGYESGHWRSKQLVDHMMEWLPEFALTYTERKNITANNAVRLVKAAARAIYQSKKFENRGEFGELLLHIAIRQVFNTLPAISKIYYKDAANDTVKGFDGVHIVATETTLELWLGESKFYDDISKAIADVVKELGVHSGDTYLRGEFATIVNKIDSGWPHAARLKKLLDPNTSLDEVFDAVCIPVLLTYDSKAVNAHSRVTAEYIKDFTEEVGRHHKTFSAKALPKMRVQLFLVPLKSKKELIAELDEALKRWQNI